MPIDKEMMEYWNNPQEEEQHTLIAGSVPWETATKFAPIHWDMISKDIPLKDNDHIMEIGCGLGRVIKAIPKDKYLVLGADISENMINGARENLAGYNVLLLPITDNKLPSPECSQFFVYSFLVFQHIPTRALVLDYLRQINKILVPGGYVRIQTFRGYPHPEDKFGGTHGHFYPTLEAFAKEFELCNFKVVSKEEGLGHKGWLWVTAKR